MSKILTQDEIDALLASSAAASERAAGPLDGVVRPASSEISVDLPAPEKPTTASTSPRATVRSMSQSTSTVPVREAYDLATPRSSRIGTADLALTVIGDRPLIAAPSV